MADRRAHPGDDLLTKLIETEDRGDQLSEHELNSTAILLFAAGFETTTHLIGNGLLALLRHPDQLDRLRVDPTLVRTAVESCCASTARSRWRSGPPTRDLSIGGYRIETGSLVLALLGAANRDPARFRDPDRLDVGRDEGHP